MNCRSPDRRRRSRDQLEKYQFLARPRADADLVIVRRIDTLHVEHPFAGSACCGMLKAEGGEVIRVHVAMLMRKMGGERSTGAQTPRCQARAQINRPASQPGGDAPELGPFAHTRDGRILG